MKRRFSNDQIIGIIKAYEAGVSDGPLFRVVCVVYVRTREPLADIVDRSLSGARTTRELDTVTRQHCKPEMIVSDNGTEMTSHAALA